jgi:hypothetical protein
MNCKEIQDILMIESYTKPIQITNYSGIGYEADVLMITKSGIAYEYEVKKVGQTSRKISVRRQSTKFTLIQDHTLSGKEIIH